jgi:hypothetical protein
VWPPGATLPAAQLLAGGRSAAGLRGGLAAGGGAAHQAVHLRPPNRVSHAGQAATAAGGSTGQVHRPPAAAGAHLVGRSAAPAGGACICWGAAACAAWGSWRLPRGPPSAGTAPLALGGRLSQAGAAGISVRGGGWRQVLQISGLLEGGWGRWWRAHPLQLRPDSLQYLGGRTLSVGGDRALCERGGWRRCWRGRCWQVVGQWGWDRRLAVSSPPTAMHATCLGCGWPCRMSQQICMQGSCIALPPPPGATGGKIGWGGAGVSTAEERRAGEVGGSWQLPPAPPQAALGAAGIGRPASPVGATEVWRLL